jgi:hypothetical protein
MAIVRDEALPVSLTPTPSKSSLDSSSQPSELILQKEASELELGAIESS